MSPNQTVGELFQHLRNNNKSPFSCVFGVSVTSLTVECFLFLHKLIKLFKRSCKRDSERSVFKCRSRGIKQINSSWSSCVNVKITSKKLQQTETNPLEPNAVAKRHRCQNLAHWLDRMVLPGNRCLVSTLPGSTDKKLEVHTHTHTHTHTHCCQSCGWCFIGSDGGRPLLLSSLSSLSSGHWTVNVPCCCRGKTSSC